MAARAKTPITMHDVARSAGVSITTVSHVINQTRPIAVDTRARVLKAIKDLQYYQNRSARLLVRGYSDALGLIISDIENPFFPQLIKGFERACHDANLDMILGMTNYEEKSAAVAIRRMIEDKVRGVAIMSMEFDSKLVALLLDQNIPVVRLNSVHPRSRSSQTSKLSSLQIDYSTGVYQAVEHLRSLGHRDIAIVHGPATVFSAMRYRQMMMSAAREYGMKIIGCIEVESRPAGGVLAVQKLMSQKKLPTAILCGNDLIAIGAIGEALQSGWSVPKDVSIVGSDDIAVGVYCRPALSTVRVQKGEVGLHAFRMLAEMIQGNERRGLRVEVKTDFISRESTGIAKI